MTEYTDEALIHCLCVETGNYEFLLFQLLWDKFKSLNYVFVIT
jgi:hypothetical protein